MESLQSMHLFVRVVRAGSFSAAGRDLGLAPSSISRQVNALEDELGVRLLNRTTRALNLTQAGMVYFERASQILDDVEAAHREVSELDAKPRGTLRITAPVTFGRLHVATALPGFLALNPELQVEFTASDQVVDLIEEGVDVFLVAGDIFDTMSPPPEAERLLYAALRRLVEARIEVVLVAGNHDNPRRLAAFGQFADLSGNAVVIQDRLGIKIRRDFRQMPWGGDFQLSLFYATGQVRLNEDPWEGWQGGNPIIENEIHLSSWGLAASQTWEEGVVLRASIGRQIGSNDGRNPVTGDDSDGSDSDVRAWFQAIYYF